MPSEGLSSGGILRTAGMATIIQTIDDIDGSTDDVQTVHFSLEGDKYEIDLGSSMRSDLFSFLEPYITNARTPKTKATRNQDVQKIRDWARSQNIEVSARGRISAEVRQAYADAQ